VIAEAAMHPVGPIAASSLHMGEFAPPVLVCLSYLWLYAARARTLAHERRAPATWRYVSFVAGVLLVLASQLPPFDTLADTELAAHMVQHIVIGDIASFLIVIGLTGPMLAPLLRLRASRPIRRLAHPIVALILWAADLYAWHLPLFYQLAIRHDLVHALEHACLLWFGMLLWLSLLGPLPKPAWFTGWARLGYVVGVRFLGAVLANVLIFAQTILYPVYAASDARRGLNPISDQNIAGGIMMVEQVLLTTLLIGWLLYRWTSEDGQRQDLLDLAAERGIELSDTRAARAAGAGRTAQLRDRLLDH
jgi:cytochrome c oxidase assembly factor CtaG